MEHCGTQKKMTEKSLDMFFRMIPTFESAKTHRIGLEIAFGNRLGYFIIFRAKRVFRGILARFRGILCIFCTFQADFRCLVSIARACKL